MNTPIQAPIHLRIRPEHTSSRALASLLLAAGVSALVVVADQLMESWADHHLLAAWLALWAIAVLAIVLLRGLSRTLARKVMLGLDAWSARLAQRRADRRLWAMAQTDQRLMRELQVALDHHEVTQCVPHLAPRSSPGRMRNCLHYL